MQAGQRYVGELHVRIVGDNAAGQRALPAARLLMGQVLADAQNNQLGRHSMRKQLGDGTLVLAEKIGDINRVTITPPGGAPPTVPQRPPDDFVVWARTAEISAGIDPEFPQQILRRDKSGLWTTFFYSSETAGHDDYPGDKGTYGGLFVEGLRHAGNIDWQNDRGEVISWYGPSGRYWVDAFVQPRYQFGKHVFMLGAVLLETDQYAEDSPDQEHGPDRYITGAALKRTGGTFWLYTVQSEAKDTDHGPGPYYVDDTAAVSCPFSIEENEGGIYRYRLAREVDSAGVMRYRVINGSRERLAELPGNHAEPWFFSQSCVLAHCYVLDPGGWFYRKYNWMDENPEADFPPMAPVVPVQTPNPSQTFREAVFDDDGGCELSDTSLTVSQSPASPTHFVADYKGDKRVYGYITDYSRTLFPGFTDGQGFIPGHGPVLFSLCGTDVGNVNTSFFPGSQPMSVRFPNPEPWSSFHFMFADLRTDVLVLRVTYTIQGSPVRWRQSTKVYKAGVRDFETIEASRRLASPTPLFYGTIGFPTFMNVPGSPGEMENWPPYFYLYGVLLEPEFLPLPGPYRWAISGGNAGFSPGFLWTPYPPEAYFGFLPPQSPYGGANFWEAELLPLSMGSIVGFNGSAQDFDGHYNVLSCASKDDVVVVSGYQPVNDNNPESPPDPPVFNGNHSFSHVTGSTPEERTGVDGEWKRYHPVWLLGQPPRTTE